MFLPMPSGSSSSSMDMPVNADGLGGRVPLLDPREMTGARKKAYDVMSTLMPWAKKSGFEAQLADGKMIGPFNSLLYAPEITLAFVALQEAEGKYTTLSQRVRQVVILSVGAAWKCDYERYAHSAVAQKAGFSASSIQALTQGEPAPDLSDDERVAQRFTLDLATKHQIDDALYSEAETAFGTQGILSLLLLAGCYFTVSSVLNALKVPAPKTDSK